MAAVVTYTQDIHTNAKGVQDNVQDPQVDKISAYYSLVFPNFTYYLQTLNVTIGRRCIPASTASSSENPQVDVDLGPLKSVSRLHAKIEYDEDEERFVLVVVGRNGAWVDGVWSGSGSRVALCDRSQIQIASRTFHFVLPPPPAPPEDSPSPSSHSSYGNPPRSPSVDITSLDVTSISPPSSIPPNSPPQHAIISSASIPKVRPLTEPQLPNSNSIVRHKSTNYKKRRRSDVEAFPRGKPEVMPPKPQYTYAQLCYRAIKGLGGRGSLQDICQWIQDTYEWYKFSEKDWESSVRHNLSSNRAFKKVERGPDEKGKGALWSLDPQHEHTFEEQDARKQAAMDAKVVAAKKPKAVAILEPPLKRSVKGDAKGAPLPPPLTSAPLVKRETNAGAGGHVLCLPTGDNAPGHGLSPPPASPSLSSVTLSTSTLTPTPTSTPAFSAPPVTSSLTPAHAPSSFPSLPSSVRLPIVIGKSPSETYSGEAEPKPIVLHQNTLYLNPTIFSRLTPEQLRDLEALGAQKALEILQGYIVRFYKEKLRAEGGRGRGRGRGRRSRGGGSNSGSGRPVGGNEAELFTNAPLPAHTATTQAQPIQSTAPAAASLLEDEGDSEVIVVDDIDDSLEMTSPHAPKRRRIDESS